MADKHEIRLDRLHDLLDRLREKKFFGELKIVLNDGNIVNAHATQSLDLDKMKLFDVNG